MRDNAICYQAEFERAAELGQVILDMEGGQMLLSMSCELIQDMLAVGNYPGAAIVIRKLYEMAELPADNELTAMGESPVWLNMFREVLEDCADAA